MRRWVYLVLLLLVACGQSDTAVVEESAADVVAPSTAIPEQIIIRSADQPPTSESILSIDSSITITQRQSGTTQALLSDISSKGKRRYLDAQSTAVAEVKFSAQSFKLRSMDGTLRWKVKYKDTQVRISANEEGEHACVIDQQAAGFSVQSDATPLGVVKASNTHVVVVDSAGNTIYTISPGTPRASYGILLCEDLQAQDRLILIAELIAAGR